MTNGEKLKEIFPYLESDETDLAKVLTIDNLKSWWNTEYKESINNDIVLTYDMYHDLIADRAKKLEQESILNEIRAEIEQLSTTICTETRRIYINADDFKKSILTILDKYKAESEDRKLC